MKKGQNVWMTLVMAAVLICGSSVPAIAAGTGGMAQEQTQEQTQTQIQTQTEVDLADREQARLQARDRLQISDEAKTQYQERLQKQDQTASCFCDTRQYWAEEQIQTAYNWGLVNGYSTGEFRPENNISGVEGVLMTSRLMNCLNGETAANAEKGSIDWNLVPDWAKEQMQDQTALNIAAQSRFYGEAQLNRLQFTVMLAKAMGVEPVENPESSVVFLDQSEIPQEDLGYLAAMRTLGIIQGKDGCFCGDETVTRAEAAVMLTRVLEILQ